MPKELKIINTDKIITFFEWSLSSENKNKNAHFKNLQNNFDSLNT